MKHNVIPLLAVITIMACNTTEKKIEKMNVTPPTVEKIKKELTTNGDTRIDNYYWLNERENPKVIAYLTAENKYLDTMLSPVKGFREKLYEEMKGRIKEKDESVPYFENGYLYYTRFEEGKEYPIHCRKKGSNSAPEEVMLNVNDMAKGHEYFNVAGLNVSPDNKLLVYGVDTVSRRKYTLYVKSLETGELLKDVIAETTGGSTWANDNKTLFYTRKNPTTLRSEKVEKHLLGTDSTADKEVFFEKDETYNTYVYKTKSKKYLVIGSGSTLSSEYRILDADKPDGVFKVFHPREKDMLYDIDHRGDKFYITTNWEAKNFRLMESPLDKTSKENWKEVIPHRADVLLQGLDLFTDHMVLSERKNGLSQLRVINTTTKQEHYLDFGEPAYVAYSSTNPEMDTKVLRYGYTSLTTPNSTFDYNMDTKEKELKKQQEVIGGYDPKNYVTERLMAKATDGTLVPISLVYKKGFEKNGQKPLLLYGYGSYGNSIEPTFSSNRISLLDRGFCYAIAHIRGGQEMGRHWYEDGKMFKKKNTFTDFIDCAEYLIQQKFTSKEHLYALGGSAGGLLMGAIVNMRPDLWHGIVAAVPFVDVVTTMLDETIPLTTGEFDEWGNPKNKDSYDYMKSYSPYDNVEKKAYPNMLITTGLHDSQVQYFEPAKWIAKLRELKTDDNLLLMETNMEAGHGGASGRFKAIKDVALQYAFLLYLEGITK
ncbi:prolyl oligopeptidase family serine peptidase [Chitinophaga sp. SYP-B3965]|uniref:S9 family peptidase n=1 Tax=Chitinophaga sp. SYP-B3965 TaxID=2663120 RepID=UPI001299EC99|nr:S9 family peptidase [Chitinophaga sp. SYP-B3965]MRG47087.1 prolyl oligopeptidase family serine peptidase [Chitinophaga sp. SYP-B3965]